MSEYQDSKKDFKDKNLVLLVLQISPTRNCTNFLIIGFVVAGGGFYSYYIHHQGNKSDKEMKIINKK